MNINILEERIASLKDNNYAPIVELIINAVRDYPLYGLNDIDAYLIEIKKILNVEHITPDSINKYIECSLEEGNENNIWIVSSLGSLLEAFNLMKFYKISFKEVLGKIKGLA